LKQHLYLVLIVFIVFLAGCVAPGKIYHLTPTEKYKISWFSGLEVVKQQENDLILSIAFVENLPDMVIFSADITNRSERSIIVDPVDFYIEYDQCLLDSQFVAKAIDPEKMILAIDKNIAWKETRLKSQKRTNLIFEKSDLVRDISADRKEQDELRDKELDQLRRQGKSVNELSRENEIVSLYEKKQTWINQSLRKTVLNPDNSITGKIYFPLNKSAQKIVLKIPLDDILFSIDYYQSEIK